MKTGPYKPAPHVPQGFYIAAEDRSRIMRLLRDAGVALYGVDKALVMDICELSVDLAASRELPSAEEQTIKARMNLKATLPAYPDAETLDAQVSANLLR